MNIIHKRKTFVIALLTGYFVLTMILPGAVLARDEYLGYQPKNSLSWPLVKMEPGATCNASDDDPCPDDPGYKTGYVCVDGFCREPARHIWTGNGDYQKNGGFGDIPYIHPGIDVIGTDVQNEDDPNADMVVTVAPGHVWMAVNFSDCDHTGENNSYCRIYVTGIDDPNTVELDESRYIYYYAHLRWHEGAFINDEMAAEMKEKIGRAKHLINDPNLDPNLYPFPLEDSTINPDLVKLEKNEVIAGTHFTDWPHLHLTILDKEQNYTAINPLTALSAHNLDSGEPIIEAIQFFPNGNTTQPFQSSGGQCSNVIEISGNVDIHATVYDPFFSTHPNNYNDPSYWPQDKKGIYISPYKMSYRVDRSTGTGWDMIVAPAEWSRFDAVPLQCVGEDMNVDPSVDTDTDTDTHPPYVGCDTAMDREKFFVYLRHWSDEWAPIAGVKLAETIYSPDSVGFYGSDAVDPGIAILTNGWGIDGSWDTTLVEDGKYLVEVNSWDEIGRRITGFQWVYVANETVASCTCEDMEPNFYIRDNAEDCGLDYGDAPHYTSPDIVVVKEGITPPRNPAEIAYLTYSQEIYNFYEKDWVEDPNFDGEASNRLHVDENYWVWLRVHNNSCHIIDNIKVKVWAGQPTFAGIEPVDYITQSDDNNFVTPSEGASIAALGEPTFCPTGDQEDNWQLVGPFFWNPSTTDHFCLMAFIDSAQDPRVDSGNTIPYDNIAQRNIQILGNGDDNDAVVGNDTLLPADVGLRFNCNDLPIYTGGVASLLIDYHPALEDWIGTEGTIITTIDGETEVQFTQCLVNLPPVELEPGVLLSARVELDLPASASNGKYTVYATEYLNGEKYGGMAYSIVKESVPPVI